MELRADMSTSIEQMLSSDQDLQFYTCRDFQIAGLQEPVEIGFRVYGAPKKDGSNVVLAPTWLGASSADFKEMEYIGPGQILDTDRYCIIVVDALGNGISTSPSTIASEQALLISMDDMVSAQYELLTQHLNLEKIHAILGISMGGMQAFKWLERYPGFVSKVSTIVSAVEVGQYDKVCWTTYIDIANQLLSLPGGEELVRDLWSKIDCLVFRSPHQLNEVLGEQSMDELFEESRLFSLRMEIVDRIAQMDAIRKLDIKLPHPSDLKTELQFIYAETDVAVTPFASLEKMKPYSAELVPLPTPHGHLSLLADMEFLNKAVNAFLSR